MAADGERIRPDIGSIQTRKVSLRFNADRVAAARSMLQRDYRRVRSGRSEMTLAHQSRSTPIGAPHNCESQRNIARHLT
jgi:hypothetical protein